MPPLPSPTDTPPSDRHSPTASAALVGLALLSLALSGCGGDEAQTPPAPSGAGDRPTVPGGPAMPPAPGPTTLDPLPDPSLTAPPTAADEPIPEGVDFHTATGFAVVRDPRAFPQPVPAVDLTEADFAAGLPEAVVERPADVDPTLNGAPFFEGIDNVRLVAGQSLRLRFVPRDPEGELPGMFPLQLPEGASFDDNFDGTKTLSWQPLQADIGVTAFTAVAIDPAEPGYRTSQTVLILVDAPEDPATIPNVAPEVSEVPEYVVRAGDPVVVEIEGIDRNGTVPTLELPDPPAGATFLPRPFEPERFVLRLVPDAPGVQSIEVIARDAVDASLIGTGRVVLDVRAPATFERTGSRLRSLAAARGIEIGSAVSPFFYRQADGALYADIAGDEFGVMTPESSMKMDAINPRPGRYAFADTDNLMRFAQAQGMSVRGHPLVWHRQLPDWVLESAPETREGHMREFIARIAGRYADDVTHWDVVNEPIADGGGMRSSVWFDAMGESYIDVAFRQARAADPDATLVLNEYDIGFDGPKWDDLLALIDRLIARDVPVDAIGFQLHVFAGFDRFDELAAHMAEVAARGLDVHVTELDVALTDDTDSADQAEVYRRIAETCLAQPRCTVLQTWGFTDRYSFRRLFDPLPFDREYRAKAAYGTLQEALALPGADVGF